MLMESNNIFNKIVAIVLIVNLFQTSIVINTEGYTIKNQHQIEIEIYIV